MKNPDELGALWEKTSAKGRYMTGQIEGVGAVVCFVNSSDNPKAPQWRVMKSKPREERQVAPPITDDDIAF